jgi:hypothetical protein
LDHRHSAADHPGDLAARRAELAASGQPDEKDRLFAGWNDATGAPVFNENGSNAMTYDPNRMQDDYSDRVIGYGADHHSSGYYAVLVAGTLALMIAIFYLVGHIGGSRTVTAINPMETNTTTGQATR